MPRSHSAPRLGSACRPTLFRLLLLLLLPMSLALPATPAHAAPQLWLPTPPGENWKIIQGYACGSHNAWDRYSLDLANGDGRTMGAPVRAAADGKIWAWEGGSGTLILAHGDSFYTMYTHMDSVVSTERGRTVPRGTVIGAAGERATRGTPHLHFTAFTTQGSSMRGWQSVPLSFAEGYNLPEIGGCNQHGGKTLKADGNAVPPPAELRFSSPAEPGHWYNSDLRVEFTGSNISGFSQAWNGDPGGERPMFAPTSSGYAQLADKGEGLHTLQVRLWAAGGEQTLVSYGPVGYDITPPGVPPIISPTTVLSGTTTTLRWSAASDGGSGIAGYRVYIGSNDSGTAEWFTAKPEVEAPPLTPGSYVLRLQPIDYAGNTGSWATVGQVISAAP